jgi:hypothetical protein
MLRALGVGIGTFAVVFAVGILGTRLIALAKRSAPIRWLLGSLLLRLRARFGRDPVTQLRQRVEDLLRQAGTPRPDWLPLRTHAQTAAAQSPAVAGLRALPAAIDLIDQARFEERPPPPGRVHAVLAALDHEHPRRARTTAPSSDHTPE